MTADQPKPGDPGASESAYPTLKAKLSSPVLRLKLSVSRIEAAAQELDSLSHYEWGNKPQGVKAVAEILSEVETLKFLIQVMERQ